MINNIVKKKAYKNNTIITLLTSLKYIQYFIQTNLCKVTNEKYIFHKDKVDL